MIKNFFKNHHIHKSIVPYLDYIFIFRPTLFFAVWVMVSAGMYIGHSDILINPQWITSEISLKIIFLFTSLTFLIGATFIKEQLMFIELENKKERITPLKRNVDKQRASNMLKISIIIGIFFLLFTNIYNIIFSVLTYLFFAYYFTNKYKVLIKNKIKPF